MLRSSKIHRVKNIPEKSPELSRYTCRQSMSEEIRDTDAARSLLLQPANTVDDGDVVMPATCVAYNCRIRQSKGAGISFHRFPFERPELLYQWVKNICRKNWQPTPISLLCSVHFTADCYEVRNPGQCSRLKYNAVPTIFDFVEHAQEDLATTQKHGRKPILDIDPGVGMGRVAERECGKADEAVAECNGIGKPHHVSESGISVQQFLIKDHAYVFTDKQEVELVKCIKEAEVLFGEMTNKEMRKLVYEFACKYNKFIPIPLWDFDGLADLPWFRKFEQRHPCVAKRRKVNSRAIRKVIFNSCSINHLLNTVPDMMLAGSTVKNNFIKKENPFKCYSSSLEHENSAISDNSGVNDDPLYISENNYHVKHEWLYNNTSDKVSIYDNVFIRNVSQDKKSENCERINEVNAGENKFVMDNCVFVKEEKDTIVEEENGVLSSDEDACVQKYVLLKKDNVFICNKNSCNDEEALVKEEDVFVKEEIDDFVEGNVFVKEDSGLH